MPSAPITSRSKATSCPDETYEVTKARALARECDGLVETLNAYRSLVLRRLAAERSEWPF
jgi:hypothetical protein